MTELCCKCQKKLTSDEIGLHKKLVNRGATEYLCMKCLGEHFRVSEEFLKRKIDEFRMQGCTLFS